MCLHHTVLVTDKFVTDKLIFFRYNFDRLQIAYKITYLKLKRVYQNGQAFLPCLYYRHGYLLCCIGCFFSVQLHA